MNFDITDEQRLLIDAVSRCLAEEASFTARQAVVRTHGWSPSVWSTLCDLGVPVAVFADTDGGLGGGAMELALIAQIGAAALAVEPITSVLIAHSVLARSAPAPLRQRWLERLRDTPAVLVPAFGSAEATVRAEVDGAATVLNGRAAVVYHAPCADHLLVAAASAGAARADSLYLVPVNAAGLALQSYTTVDAQRAADLVLDGVRVGADDTVTTHDPASVDLAIDLGLLAVSAEALGSAERAVALTLEYLKTRQQFGGPIGRFQALQHRAVTCLARLEDLRTLVLLGAARFDGPTEARRTTLAALKVVAAETARHIGEEAVQLHGGMGVTEEMEISHHFRRLIATSIRYGARDEHLRAYAEARFATTQG
jgi:alkylation response protein AidB-like acyl-CoA dehydrogenase